MAKWTGYYKVVVPATDTTKITDSQRMGDQGTYGNYSWYQRLVQGSASRISRYREYDMMDYDVDVARALDTLAEDMTSNSAGKDVPIELDLTTDTENELPNNTVPTLRAALRHWCHIHDWENRLFKVARTTIKYGDCFFRKTDKFKRWIFIHPKQVTGAIVDAHDVTKIVGWQVKKNIRKARQAFGSPINGSMETSTEIVPAAEMVHFTLNSDMDDS